MVKAEHTDHINVVFYSKSSNIGTLNRGLQASPLSEFSLRIQVLNALIPQLGRRKRHVNTC